jgi:7,8-dihydropterin-6-yl-methyl-4-(beta-D-ribofuranosyl)aminobenzene 5'-phosphate synthase
MPPTAALPTLTPTPLETVTTTTAGVTLTILFDNERFDERLRADWGFACLIQGLEKTILFDTGAGSALVYNMRTLGVEPEIVDVVVLSHAHGDHVGGLQAFLDEKSDLAVYLPRSFPATIKRQVTQAGARPVEVSDPIEICARAWTTGVLGGRIQEQSLVVETAQGAVVITGCAHPGIVHIVRQAQRLAPSSVHSVHLAIGGFHLDRSAEHEIVDLIEELQRLGVERVAPTHCSGTRARRLFEVAYGDNFLRAGVGLVVNVGREIVGTEDALDHREHMPR